MKPATVAKANPRRMLWVMLFIFAMGIIIMGLAVMERSRIVALVGALVAVMGGMGAIITAWSEACNIK